jgi:hypothetical protein
MKFVTIAAFMGSFGLASTNRFKKFPPCFVDNHTKECFVDIVVAMFSMLLGQLPQMIIWLVGVGLALMHRERVPRRARLALIAFTGFLILAVAAAFINSYFTFMLMGSGPTQVAAALAASNIVLAIISAGLWILLLMALFGGEKVETVSFDGIG